MLIIRDSLELCWTKHYHISPTDSNQSNSPDEGQTEYRAAYDSGERLYYCSQRNTRQTIYLLRIIAQLRNKCASLNHRLTKSKSRRSEAILTLCASRSKNSTKNSVIIVLRSKINLALTILSKNRLESKNSQLRSHLCSSTCKQMVLECHAYRGYDSNEE